MTDDNTNIVKTFYDNLFEMAPLIKPLFKSDREIVEQHFHDLVSLAVNEIDNFSEFRPRLVELGTRHKSYGAETTHFSIIKMAFMLALQYEFKDLFNDSMENAWSNFIDEISNAMIEGLNN